MPRVSWIFLIRDSQETVRRQLLYMNRLMLPPWLEIIFCDDHSDPPIKLKYEPNFSYQHIVHTKPGDWNLAAGFNFAAKHSLAQYYMFAGIDHMISDEFVDWARTAEDDWIGFEREVALLNKYGELIDLKERYPSSAVNWIRAKTFWHLNGLDERFDGGRFGSDLDLGRRWGEMRGVKGVRKYVAPEEVFYYMFPDRQDPLRPDRMFHSLPG